MKRSGDDGYDFPCGIHKPKLTESEIRADQTKIILELLRTGEDQPSDYGMEGGGGSMGTEFADWLENKLKEMK